MERAQAEIAEAASEFDQAVGALPDPNLPVPEQLASAVTIIKSNTKTIFDSKAEATHFKKVRRKKEKGRKFLNILERKSVQS